MDIAAKRGDADILGLPPPTPIIVTIPEFLYFFGSGIPIINLHLPLLLGSNPNDDWYRLNDLKCKQDHFHPKFLNLKFVGARISQKAGAGPFFPPLSHHHISYHRSPNPIVQSYPVRIGVWSHKAQSSPGTTGELWKNEGKLKLEKHPQKPSNKTTNVQSGNLPGKPITSLLAGLLPWRGAISNPNFLYWNCRIYNRQRYKDLKNQKSHTSNISKVVAYFSWPPFFLLRFFHWVFRTPLDLNGDFHPGPSCQKHWTTWPI